MMFVFNRRFLAMAEYSSKLELCSFGLTKTFDCFRKKHITEALFLQIRVKKDILILSVLVIFSIFFTIICNAMPCALSNNHYGSTCF